MHTTCASIVVTIMQRNTQWSGDCTCVVMCYACAVLEGTSSVEAIQGTAERREQLGKWMETRRRDLRVKWTQVAPRAGMSVQNLLRIRKGQISITWDAATGIDDALRWERGSVEAAVTEGRAPTLKAVMDPPPDIEQGPPSRPSLWTAEMETKFRLLKDILKSQGLEMTEQNFLTMLDQGRIGLRTRQTSEPISADDRG